MERYNQRRFDCRRCAAVPGSCGCQTSCGQTSRQAAGASCGCQGTRRVQDSCGCQSSRQSGPSCGQSACPSAAAGSPCGCQEDCKNSNVCRPGQCSPPANEDIAMGYVPWQKWECTYPLDKGLFIGTVFPSLDKPFLIGRCAVRP